MKTKIRSQSGFLASRGLIALLFCVAASSVTTAIPTTSGLDFFSAATPAKVSHRTLTFEERVAYQRAIEDVYWRHRIWPNTNGGPKPPLDAVMSQAQLEKKVTDYLRNSQALEDYWQRPITADQLQAEMERVATHTKQPEVLRELFAALGNDPFVIAECLARPVLAERLLTNWYAYDETIHGQLKQRAAAELQAHNSVEQMKQLGGTYSEIWFIKSDSGDISQQRDARSLRLNSREWDETLQKLAATFRRAGSYLTNGRNGPLGRLPLPARSTYATVDYETIPLKEISALQEDKRRYYATTVIERTSDQLKVGTVSWLKEPLDSWLARGENEVANIMTIPSGNYQLPAISGGAGGCIDDSWTGIAANDPYPRTDHTAVWTGSEMIVWGGNSGTYLNAGERYNPSTDSWTATSMVNTPDARGNHTAVWTGTEMVVWGGADTYDLLNSGGRYNPSTDSWTPASTINAPSARLYHTAVWTGSEMIVWGGWDNISDLNTGGRYNPSTDKWTFTSTTNAPDSRWSHTAIWADSEMIVWGGAVGGGSLNTGGRYNPVTDSWTPTSMTNVPAERVFHTAVWTGTEMIVWGGTGAGGRYRAGGRYNPSTDSWIATSTTNAPAAREMHTAVWTGSEMIVWGGFLGLNTGGRYNPSTDSWIATGTTSAPDGRWFHTAVWADSEMIVWGGVGDAGTLNTGGRYNPISDNWIATTATTNNAPSARVGHTSVWSGSEMIVWGGSGNAGPVNTGGKYDPITDSWTATKTTNAPTVRERHTAVWTGSEMIVWGGGVGLNTGGKYNPGTDSWTVTSTINAPSARFYHRAVWTGSEMIVWGGTNDRTGGRYNPSTDSWTPTSTTNAPSAGWGHTAVWTDSEMIVWGGCNDPWCSGGWNNTGGRYNPDTNTWTPTSTNNPPSARLGHTAVWTNGEMIVWGGYPGPLNTGGRYNPGTDSWITTSTINAPTARSGHTAVWTDSEMIIWGGVLNTGGRYNPSTDSWTATSTINAPSARSGHTAVWADSEMIVWGGNTINNSGGRYCAAAPVSFTLGAARRKVGGINTVRLTWSGATSANIDVYRNNLLITTTANTGTYTDSTGDTGRARYTYRVCEAGTDTCSNDARVVFPQ